jgi:hypothetical protein
MALIFPHRVRHEGRPVTKGRKYAIHTFILYGSEEPITGILHCAIGNGRSYAIRC